MLGAASNSLAPAVQALGIAASAEPDRLGDHFAEMAVEAPADGLALLVRLVRETQRQIVVHHLAAVPDHVTRQPGHEAPQCVVHAQRQLRQQSQRPLQQPCPQFLHIMQIY